MKRIRRIEDVSDAERGAAAAIGNFDGVHLGHAHVLDRTCRAGAAIGAPLAVLTFEPHPREVFRPDDPPFRLMDADTRAHRLEKLGVELLFELDFGQIRPLPHDVFSAHVLGAGLGLTHVCVGADFRYGLQRGGTLDTLRAEGAAHGFAVEVADTLPSPRGAERVSSTAIRTALSEGRPRDAAAMLGHWHRIEGPVLHGEKRGRDLGYPTANMALGRLHRPRFGVYAVEVEIRDGPYAGRQIGVASLGVRPQFGLNEANLETYLFDFAGDLYGATLSVALVEFLRPEAKFDNLDALIAQMDADSAQARAVLAAEAP